MSRVSRLALILAVLALLALPACSGQPVASPARSPSDHRRGESPAPTSTSTRTPAPPGRLNFRVDTVASGLDVPWSLVFLPGTGMLVTERPGRVRLIQNGQLQPQPVLTLSVVAAPGVESGLLGIALHPGFPNPPDIYLYYVYNRNGQHTDRVSRFQYADGRLASERVVLDGIPGGQCCHFGGRIGFGPDGMLYVAVGDAQVPARAADKNSPNGKILRVRDDGSVPEDNPFPGSPAWAWGLRNPQGLAWDPDGRLYASNNGPTGEFGLFHNDEIDLVQKGAFYGWPVKAASTPAGRSSDFGNPPDRVPTVAESGNTTWAPSGMTAYRPDPGQQPTLLVAALAGQQLRRFFVDPANPGQSTGQEVVLTGYGRLRDAVTGPDNCVYVLTNNRDGRGNPQSGDDKMLRLCPQ
jgi:glucose/arabinose dehydrogenase